MKLSECKAILRELAEPRLAEYGFEFAKSPAYHCSFRKYDAFGYDVIYFQYDASYGCMSGYAAIGHSFEAIESPLFELQKHVELECPHRKEYPTYYFNSYSLSKRMGSRRESFENVATKDELSEVVEKVIILYRDTGREILQRYADMRDFDRLINTEPFWENPYLQMLYVTPEFPLKRMISAKLTGNPRYDEIVERTFDIDKTYRLKQMQKDSPESIKFMNEYTMENLTKRIPYAAHYLKDVKPLFDSYET